MNKHMTATEARKKFYAVILSAQRPGATVTITHDGLPKVVMMSFEEYEGWLETMEIMSDPSLMADIQEALREAKAGKIKDTIDLDTLKKKLKI